MKSTWLYINTPGFVSLAKLEKVNIVHLQSVGGYLSKDLSGSLYI
jgi:hypothetical protein